MVEKAQLVCAGHTHLLVMKLIKHPSIRAFIDIPDESPKTWVQRVQWESYSTLDRTRCIFWVRTVVISSNQIHGGPTP